MGRLALFFAALLICAAAQATLLVGVAVRDGVVLAADSRLSRVTAGGDHQVMSDSHIKLTIVQDRFLVATGGKSHLDGRPLWQHVMEAGGDFPKKKGCASFCTHLADRLTTIYRQTVPGDQDSADLTLLVAGYEGEEGQLAELKVPQNTVNLMKSTTTPGLGWSGDLAIPNRLIFGVDPEVRDDARWDAADRKALGRREFVLAAETLPLADAVALARLIVQTAIGWSAFVRGTVDNAEHFHPTIGGPVDVAVVTPSGARWVDRKPTYTADTP